MAVPIQNLMLIDDNEADRFLFGLIIEESGLVANLSVFNMAEDALTHLRHAGLPVDAIPLDIRMPRMSGFEFVEAALAEFGADFAKVVVIMLTTSLDPADGAKARQFGVIKRYFEKPLTTEHLQTIAAMVSNSS